VATPGIVAVASAQQTSAAGAVSNEPIVERNWGSFFRGMACGVSVGVAISTGGAAIAGAVVICTLTLASECE
jgi:predicted lipid-binding transport protein (Tim44 family)